MAHHSPRKHRGAGPGMRPVEKAKDFKGSMLKLLQLPAQFSTLSDLKF